MASCPRFAGYCQLYGQMRMLWQQHAAWTKMTIDSIVEGSADEEFTTRRLLRNPADIAAVFRPLYGNAIADRLQELLTEHLVLAAQLVKESKAGETAAAAETERRWYANGNEIAAFLNSINPFWGRAEMERMWREHLDLVKAQAVARLNGEYETEIARYDEGEQLLLRMADVLTAGIVRQFPCFYAAM